MTACPAAATQRANADLAAQRGRPFISTPDLGQKLKNGTVLTAPDFSTFYTLGEKGYTDY